MDAHNLSVATIAKRVEYFHQLQKPFRIYHGSTNSTRQSQYRHDNIVDISKLNNIIAVDQEKKVVLVEPNVPLDELVAATLPLRLIPPVVMEFPGITVGGGFSGTSGESSSFRYGLFQHTINWVEIVLPNGEIVSASNVDRPDLFRGAASAFGTLGVVTLLEVQLVDARHYVALTYRQVSNIPEAIKCFKEATQDVSTNYVDGIVLAKDRVVICTGRLTDQLGPATVVQQFRRARDPWFFVHVKKMKSLAAGPVTEMVPLVDYLFRYDRGAFWVGMYAYKYFIVPFNRITRYVLDHCMHTRVMYRALHKSGLANKYIVQDVAVPYHAADEFTDWLNDNVGIYPLWLCPLGKGSNLAQGLLAVNAQQELTDYYLNFGVWGPGPSNRRQFVNINRRLEKKVEQLQGQKCLYAHTYYTEEEFWRIYSRFEYDALRAKYHASYLPNIYDKVKVDIAAEEARIHSSLVVWLLSLFWSIWPLSGLYGGYKAVIGGDYLLPKKRAGAA